jgi:hypothetical protein
MSSKQKRRNLSKIVKELAKVHDIKIVKYKNRNAIRLDGTPVHAYATIIDGQKEIHIPPVKGGVTLAIALHEIGHLVCDGQQWSNSSDGVVLEDELAAWLFAKKMFEQLEVAWTSATANMARTCITLNALEYQKKKKKLPAIFKSLIKLHEMGF